MLYNKVYLGSFYKDQMDKQNISIFKLHKNEVIQVFYQCLVLLLLGHTDKSPIANMKGCQFSAVFCQEKNHTHIWYKEKAGDKYSQPRSN